MKLSDFLYRLGFVWTLRIFAFCLLWNYLGGGWQRGFASLLIQAVFEAVGFRVYGRRAARLYPLDTERPVAQDAP